MTKIRLRKRTVFFALMCCAICLGAFLLWPGLHLGHDCWFHLNRMKNIVTAMQNGHVLMKVYPEAMSSYGYATGMFYSDFFLHIPALAVLLGMRYADAYELFLLLIFVSIVISTYVSAYGIWKDEAKALLATFLYSLSTYFIYDCYTRSALGETLAFVFVPPLLLGLYRTTFGEYKKITPWVVGMTGVILSHHLSCLMLSIFLLLFIMFFSKKFIREPKRILRLAVAVVIVVALTAFYTFPMLEQMMEFPVKVQENITRDRMSQATLSLRTLFMDFGRIAPCLGITMLLSAAAVVVCALCGKLRRGKSFEFALAFLALLSSVLTLDVFPWESLPDRVNIFQCAWRFLLPATAFLSFSGAAFLSEIIESIKETRGRYAVYAAVLVLCAVQCIVFADAIHLRNDDVSINISSDNAIIENGMSLDANYFPITCTEFWSDMRENYIGVFPKNDGTVVTNTKEYNVLTTQYRNNQAGERILVLPLLYYKGYEVRSLDSGEIISNELSYMGFVSVQIKDVQGVLQTRFVGTPLQKVCSAISAVGFALCTVFFVRTRRRRFSSNDACGI